MRSLLGSAGVALAVVVACGDSGKQPTGGAGRSPGNAGESGEAGAPGGGGGNAGRGGASGNGGAGGKAGSPSSGGGAGSSGGKAGMAGTAEAGAGGVLGEPGSLLPSFGKGTRLDVKALRAGDMPPVFVTFYDTELEVDCRFTPAADGTRRCLPAYTPRMPLRATQMFLDDACEVPVAVGDETCVAAEDAYFTEGAPVGDTCAERTELVFRATLLEDGVPIFSNAGGTCTGQGTTGGTLHYFGIEEADPADFVEGSIEIAETPTRLSVQRLVAGDGAFQTLALADPAVSRECRVFGPIDAEFCVPAPAFSGRDYRASDDECSVPLSLATCSLPLTIVDLTDRDDYAFVRAGAEYTGTVYGGINVCDVVTGEGPFYELGEPVPESEFPNVTRAYQGTGRLRHLVYSDAAGTELAVGAASGTTILSESGLFDTDFGEACSLQRYTDLARYCVPESITWESPNNLFYRDSGCTEQVVVCGDGGCPRDVALLLGAGEGAVCGVIPDFVSVLTLGDTLELDELYIWYGGREPGTECDGPFPTDGYGVIREVSGETGVEAFVELVPTGG